MKKRIKSNFPEGFVIIGRGIVPRREFNPKKDNPPVADEIVTCEKWLKKYAKPYSKINDRSGSYTLKHKVEDWANKYVSNGAFIYAAFSLDYRIEVIDDGPNAYFGMKLYTPEEKWKHVRSTGFSRWLFERKDENSMIGDLSRDAVFDDTWPRKAKEFIEFWDYLNSVNPPEGCLNSLCIAWESYSGDKPPAPTEQIIASCEALYEGECDILNYGDTYKDAPEGTTYIYVLFEENEKFDKLTVRYVGQTVSPASRLQQHTISPGNIDKVAWIGGLLNKGTFPKMAIVDCVPISDSAILERAYIYAFTDYEKGIDQKRSDVLLNKTII